MKGDSGFAITQDGLTLGMNHIGKFNGLHGLETGDLYVPTGVRRLPKGQQQADECPYVTYFTRNGWGDYFELRNNTFFNNLFKKDSDGKTDYSFKFAVARNGKMLYSFVNDTLVGVYSNPEFENITSIPGAYMYGSGSNATMFAKGIKYFGGEQAQNKIDELLMNNIIMPYDSRSYNINVPKNIRIDSRNGFTVLTDSGSTNDAVASPYVIFGDDFTLNWTYKKINATATDVSDAYVRIRTGEDSQNTDYFDLGINYPKDGQASLFAKVAGWDRSNGTKLTLDDSEGINFKLTRKVVDGLDHYTLIAASVKNPSETQQVSINSTKFNGKIRLLFQNRRLSGTYTNIMYSNIAE